jgi:hypothetical protein
MRKADFGVVAQPKTPCLSFSRVFGSMFVCLSMVVWGGAPASPQSAVAWAAAHQRHAFIWEHGQMQDLNNVIPDGTGWVLDNATGINKHGQIVGTGVHNGQFSGFLLTPCDEHETGAPLPQADEDEPEL